jgi:hypothetical protein
MNTEPPHRADNAPERGVIALHLRDWNQLFDSLDPSPFHEKDLDRNAEAYIVDSVKELSTRSPAALVIHLDQPPRQAEESHDIGDAIRTHFARRAHFLQRDLRQLIHRGLVSLSIGLTFLAAVFLLAQFIMQMMGETDLAKLFRESLLIVGWVAMWRPLEIFLYDWWPILGEQRLHDRLSRIEVRIVYKTPN